jgi:ABC-type sugar transport system permease subunit
MIPAARDHIRTLPIYTYMRTFAYYEAGLGSAMAVVMLALQARMVYFRICGMRNILNRPTVC